MVMTNVVKKETLRKVQLETLNALKNVLAKSFGPFGSNTIIYKNGGLPRYTKDGHTILSSLMFSGDIERSVHSDILEETSTQAKKVGDSTTSITILSALIFEKLAKLEASNNIPPKDLEEAFKSVTTKIKKEILKHAKTTTVEDMYKIALISTNNNEDFANEIKHVYNEYGNDVYIDVKASVNGTTYLKELNGMILDCGTLDPVFTNNPETNSCDILNPKIYKFIDPIDDMEMGQLLDTIISDNIIKPMSNKKPVIPTIIMAPKISRDFSRTIDTIMDFLARSSNSNKGYFNIITNITSADMEQYEDICTMCGCRDIKKYIDPKVYEMDVKNGNAATVKNVHKFAGTAEMVSSDINKSKFINPAAMYNEDGSYSDLYKNRLEWLENQVKKLEIEGNNTIDIYNVKKRLNSFKGKMVEIYVGGITVADRDQARDLMEDAVLNCRSASKNGFGFGANYEGLRAATIASTCETNSELENNIACEIYNAYREISKILYLSVVNSEDEAKEIIDLSIVSNDGPMNIRTKKFDGSVLSSIDTDICTIDTISKIVTIMATANQFLMSNINSNIY